MSDPVDERDSKLINSITIGNILIVMVFALSLVYETFSIWVAIGLSLLIWVLFADVLGEIAIWWRRRVKIIEKGGSLHQYCSNCGLRFSSEKTICPKCNSDIAEMN